MNQSGINIYYIKYKNSDKMECINTFIAINSKTHFNE